MNQYAHDTLRKTIEIEIPTIEIIEELAKESKRSFSYMAFMLLQAAIREKQRKRSAKDKIIQ